MNEMIKKLILEGKSDEEIASAVLESDEKAIASEIAKSISIARKSEEVKKSLKQAELEAKKLEDEKKYKEEMNLKVNSIVDEKLKSVFHNNGKFAKVRELKTFDPITKKVIEVKTEMSDAYAAFNAMLDCGLKGDKASAASIGAEIEQDNRQYERDMNSQKLAILASKGIKAANDPTASDTDARGGYAIPTEVDMVISQLLYGESVMLANMNLNNIVYNDKIYPLMYSMSVADIADEDTAVTESQAVFTNPTISMKRAGLFTNISNTIIRMKGANLVQAFVAAAGSEFAKFLDLRLAVGNVTTQGDKVDGIAFDTNTNAPTAFALNALTINKIKDIINTISANVGGEIVMIGNRKVVGEIGLLENSAGNLLFPQYINGGNISPLGVKLSVNKQIGSALDIGGDARLDGTDDVLLCYVKEYAIAGVSGDTRIDFADQFRFTNDVTTMRAIKSYGSKVLSATGTAGIVAVAQELTN